MSQTITPSGRIRQPADPQTERLRPESDFPGPEPSWRPCLTLDGAQVAAHIVKDSRHFLLRKFSHKPDKFLALSAHDPRVRGTVQPDWLHARRTPAMPAGTSQDRSGNNCLGLFRSSATGPGRGKRQWPRSFLTGRDGVRSPSRCRRGFCCRFACMGWQILGTRMAVQARGSLSRLKQTPCFMA